MYSYMLSCLTCVAIVFFISSKSRLCNDLVHAGQNVISNNTYPSRFKTERIKTMITILMVKHIINLIIMMLNRKVEEEKKKEELIM